MRFVARNCVLEIARPKLDAPLSAYSLASCAGAWWKIPPPETCDAIRNAATTAGTLISLRN
jgi:hypothetical protein